MLYDLYSQGRSIRLSAQPLLAINQALPFHPLDKQRFSDLATFSYKLAIWLGKVLTSGGGYLQLSDVNSK